MSVRAGKDFLEEMQKAGRVAADSGEPRLRAAGKSTQKRATPERDMQAALFEMAAYKEGERPALKLLFAVPNGQYRKGQRKEAGMKAGVPDVALMVARSGYNGLFLELKSKRGTVRDSQRLWLERLREQGYAACVVRSLDEAWTTLSDYLDDKLQTT